MKIEEWKTYIAKTYHVTADYPWKSYSNHCVFRHVTNRKWFVLMADVPRNKLGLEGSEIMYVLNLKLDPMLISVLQDSEGFFPAYHMSKTKWISVAIDSLVPDEQIMGLIDMSFQLTKEKAKSKGAKK